MDFKGFIGGTYALTSVNASAQECINYMPFVVEATGEPWGAGLVVTPGLTRCADVKNGPHRGAIECGGLAFFVANDGLYQMFRDYTWAPIGTISGNVMASMAWNGKQLAIANGGLYIYTPETGVLQSVSGPWTEIDTIKFSDGYFIAMQSGVSKWWISGLYDGTTWDALDFASAEGLPDTNVGMEVSNRELIIYGQQSAEVYYNSGDGTFPYQRIQGGLIEEGLAAKNAVSLVDNTPVWLSSNRRGDRTVRRMIGYQAIRISTEAMEQEIQRYERADDAESWSYQMHGHEYFVLTFPSVGVTWVWDAATKQWHKRAFWDEQNGVWARYRPRTHMFAFGKHICGDCDDGRMYIIDPDSTLEDGQAMRRLRRSPHISVEMNRITISTLTLTMDMGTVDRRYPAAVVLENPPEFPVMLRVSKDGGRTWGNERWATIGQTGQYGPMVWWRRLGMARNWVIEISNAVPAYHTITGCSLDLEVEP